MALRRHRLPRFWLGLTLGLVACGIGATYWWEQQLPQRLEQAAKSGDLEACLRYSEQLEALRWMGVRPLPNRAAAGVAKRPSSGSRSAGARLCSCNCNW